MKKRFLTGCALMGLSVVSFAQINMTTVNQRGTNQSADAVQTGNNLESSITQDQQSGVSVGNYATTVQTGTGGGTYNHVYINQNNGSQSNRAGVTQVGTGNTGVVTQSDNSGSYGTSIAVTAATTAATVREAGGNWGNIVQQGNNNTQTHIIQSNNSSANFGEILQYGNQNLSTNITQLSDSHSNTTRIIQGSANAGVSGNRVNISQLASSENTVTITQLTNDNQAYVDQTMYTSSGTATINQLAGTGSYAYISQYNSHYSQAVITQQANNSRAVIVQQAYYNQAEINQDGTGSDGNRAYISQGESYNQAFVNQLNGSAGNVATIEQTRGGTASILQNNLAVNNQATILQHGYFDTRATIDQINARDGKATIDQDDLCGASIKQGAINGVTSIGNQAIITQKERSNYAQLEQVGSFNQATINQTGNPYDDRNANGGSRIDALQQGISNTLTVSQSSINIYNQASVNQMGNSNTATVTQNGSYL